MLYFVCVSTVIILVHITKQVRWQMDKADYVVQVWLHYIIPLECLFDPSVTYT